jgi:hypothetical protein
LRKKRKIYKNIAVLPESKTTNILKILNNFIPGYEDKNETALKKALKKRERYLRLHPREKKLQMLLAMHRRRYKNTPKNKIPPPPKLKDIPKKEMLHIERNILWRNLNLLGFSFDEIAQLYYIDEDKNVDSYFMEGNSIKDTLKFGRKIIDMGLRQINTEIDAGGVKKAIQRLDKRLKKKL